MRYINSTAALVSAVLVSGSALAQEMPAVTTKGHAPSVATTAFTGTIQQTVDVTIASPIAAQAGIYCEFAVNASGSTVFAYDSVIVKAVRKGKAATCDIVLPYSWNLDAAPTATITLNVYSVKQSALVADPTAEGGKSIYRYSSPSLPGITSFTAGQTVLPVVSVLL